MSLLIAERIADIAAAPAPVHFVSYEPALGPLSIQGADPLPDWIIAGGESGPGHRAPDPQWFRDLRDECAGTSTAFLFKQWGGATPKANGRLLDGRTWDEVPAAPAEVA